MAADITLQDARLRLLQFGALVRQTRIEREQTLARLAAHVGVDEPKLSRIERGLEVVSYQIELDLESWILTDPTVS